MAQQTFDNAMLCRIWSHVAKNKGTRADVVRQIIEEAEIPDDGKTFNRIYGNITQRVKSLEKAGAKFPELQPGKRGRRTTPADVDALQALLDGVEG